MTKVDKKVCRKTQGVAEPGNTCLTTPGTCESCPDWVKPNKLDESKFIRRYMYGSTQREGFRELWETWKGRWGELQAADALLIAMCEFEARFQDLRRLVAGMRKRKKNART